MRKVIAIILFAIISISSFGYSLYNSIRISCGEVLPYNNEVISNTDCVWQYLDANKNFDCFDETQDRVALRNKIANVVGLKCYQYKEYDRLGGWGLTNFGFRKISVVKGLNINNYIDKFAHEAIHLKYYNKNERWTTYKTFVVLFESNDKDLKQCAINWAYEYVGWYTVDSAGNSMVNQVPNFDYDPAYYIIQYLRGEILSYVPTNSLKERVSVNRLQNGTSTEPRLKIEEGDTMYGRYIGYGC